jgi:hypothetical protein
VILTPKDWRKFQHYTDRSPPWIKLHRPLLDDVKFQRLPIASRALAPMLWLLAAEYEGGAINEDVDDLAFRLRWDVEELKAALGALIEKGFFICGDDACEMLAASKQDALPEREKETEVETEVETEKEADARAKDRTVRAPSRFDEFWQAYPRRDGPNPRKPAEVKFNALVQTGLDPEMLIAAVCKLASDEAARGNVGTRFIPLASTWLNQQRWADHAAVAVAAALAAPSMSIETALDQYVRLGIWSRHAPCGEPGTTSCTATAEQLAKHGLTVDGRKLSPQAA